MSALKNVILEACELMNTIAEVAEDGKFEFWKEMGKFVPHLLEIPAVAKDVKNCISELNAKVYKDDAWRAAVIESAKQRLKWSNETAETIAEVAIAWVLHTIAGVMTI